MYCYFRPAPKFDNPNFVRDRFKVMKKPQLPEDFFNRTRKPFNPVWMDYCDPYHCNDNHKTACGLNRNNMKFKWFQSACHIILNNMCANYRGHLKYDYVDTKFCIKYVMFLRTDCEPCFDDVESPVCGVSTRDYHAVIFKNKCALKTANCEPGTLHEYKELELNYCTILQLFQLAPDQFFPPQKKRLRSVISFVRSRSKK
ncbi:uncharacterized protein LOC114358370 [Ostrinia furnacalis]|uniref:uncharacterized protein LOC114358370 n=1 Tax=Ostrinia furnacalis TaxID=93504 RepID=UPI00103BC26D|nr:uncharacterized protein LOC114358370 [Ostrinia furnacalis]